MRRGRNKPKRPLVVDDVRKSLSPIVVVCHSSEEWSTMTEPLCSRKNAWNVLVYTPDIDKWWDHSSRKNSRASHEPPEGTLSHLVLIYSKQNNVQDRDLVVHEAALRVGERLDIATVAILRGEAPPEAQQAYETAIQNTSAVISDESQGKINHLWSLHDAFDLPKAELQWKQVDEICSWPPVVCRWNSRRLRNLYQRLRQGRQVLDEEKYQDGTDSNNDDMEGTLGSILDWDNLVRVHSLRQRFEGKMATLLEDDACKRTADQVLSARADDNFVFGRKLALSAYCALPSCDYLVAINKGNPVTLNSLAYATATHCSSAIDQLQIITQSQAAKEQRLAIPIGNPMITIRLIPALCLTGTEENGIQPDPVLGTRRIWQEHMALKASIMYVFEGQSARLWDLAMAVVENALPRIWDLLFLEPPDEQFLRALFHPDVVKGGRLRRKQNGQRLLPSLFETMARIYSIARFFRTLPKSILERTKEDAVRWFLSSTMKISPDQVNAVARKCMSGPFGSDDCMSVLSIPDSSYAPARNSAKMKKRDTEILGMLAVFLHRDRQSYRDTIDGTKVPDLPPIASCTSQILADCAMYCGAIRWLSENEQEEEGLWTCLQCLHRWQMRDKGEAFQTRKLMHPMKMTPFSRAEYYDPEEWDNIMEATNGQINKLGIDYYWGVCSTNGCRRISPAVARAGACAETDGVPLDDFPETITRADKSEFKLRAALEKIGTLGANNAVISSSLEKYFDSDEKLAMLPGPIRRRVRNCIDKSRYILPRGVLCKICSIPTKAIDEYCPYCGTGFEPVFACVHYTCPQCDKHFCKACLGIDGIHFDGVYSKANHVCWRVLGNRYSYHNRGLCAKCGKERPWPKSHTLVSAGPQICRKAIAMGGMALKEAVALQADNLARFTSRYPEAAEIFDSCSHTADLGKKYCHCGPGVDADEFDGADYY